MTDTSSVGFVAMQTMLAIQTIVATKLGRVSVTWDEVEEIYASGDYPEINEAIDYIVGPVKYPA